MNNDKMQCAIIHEKCAGVKNRSTVNNAFTHITLELISFILPRVYNDAFTSTVSYLKTSNSPINDVEKKLQREIC